MSARTLTMANPEVPPLFRRLFFLVGKIGLVIFFTVVAGWGYGLVLLKANVFLDIVHRISVLLTLSVVSGLMARYILQAQHGKLLSWLTAFVSITAGLVDLYSLSEGRIGAFVFNYASSSVNWEAAWQLALGSLVILMALNAWPKPAGLPESEMRAHAQTASTGPTTLDKPVRKTSQTRTRRSRKTQDDSLRVGSNQAAASSDAHLSKRRTSGRNAGRQGPLTLDRRNAVETNPLPVVKFHRAPRAFLQTATPATGRTSRRPSKSRRSPIHLVGREEHRCPYCLCVVSPRDPEGVMICPVCHTYHHKACWDVTGNCQVPHIHA